MVLYSLVGLRRTGRAERSSASGRRSTPLPARAKGDLGRAVARAPRVRASRGAPSALPASRCEPETVDKDDGGHDESFRSGCGQRPRMPPCSRNTRPHDLAANLADFATVRG
jgi:hypothetical protein